MAINTITATIGALHKITTLPINYQYDITQVLQITGVELPFAYQIDFCNDGDTETITVVSTEDGAQIPDQLLATGRDIKAYVVLTDGDSTQTRYEITIPVTRRPARSDVEPTTQEQTTIDSLIDALNEGVERAEDAADSIRNMNVEAEGIPAGTPAAATWDGETDTLTLRIPAGETGPQGPAGPAGETGPQGPAGQNGVSPAVTVTDIAGGHRVTITDATGTHTFDVMDGQGGGGGGENGATFTPAVSEAGVISWTNDKGLPNPSPVNIKGPAGAQGPQGETGPAGPQGAKGDKGDKGDTGDTGATGPQGPKGDKGDKGDTGATGPQGPAGDDYVLTAQDKADIADLVIAELPVWTGGSY